MEVWTDKYRPQKISDIAGQGKPIEDVLKLLSQRGKAVLIYGPPGTGKTLFAEALAREKGWSLMQLNAADKRRAAEIEYFSQTTKTASLWQSGKLIILDEVDGISSSDRGAAGAIADLIKNSKWPVILTANDPWIPKLKPLLIYCKLVKFSRLLPATIAKRLREIVQSENIKTDENVLQALAKWSKGDMRSAINDLQMISQGRISITDSDLEILGYRERESSIYEVLPAFLRSRKISAARQFVYSCDRDPDEILLWVEQNLPLEFSAAELPRAYDYISKANLLRQRVMKQQNWRLKGYMADIISGISVLRKTVEERYVKYESPQRIVYLGRTKMQRAATDEFCGRIGQLTHCSKKIVKREYLPYLKTILEKETSESESAEEQE